MSSLSQLPALEREFPQGWKIVELKTCENCLTCFTRDRCNCQIAFTGRCGCKKYCANCVGNMLMPVNLQDYKDALPTEAEQRHAHHLPKYDDSLLPKERRRLKLPGGLESSSAQVEARKVIEL